ncbi:MAG: S1 RNA-binding domain-containing protein [Candidatus Improbicoccus devescovinae]|nr:MAG: S1 RNA-binding domain-containing protein [Candidatus Improbicoccus devescovinae]
MNVFFPEGHLINNQENRNSFLSYHTLLEARDKRKILEARAIVCDSEHNLLVDLHCMKGIIPREEGAVGIKEGTTRDIAIISKVNKPVCFMVMGFKDDGNDVKAILSRKYAQELCIENKISNLIPGDVIPARVTHMENFGVFADIGCGIISFLPIDSISVSRISHPNERFKIGENIKVIVKSLIGDRINLTHKELLGTWEENVSLFNIGETVPGIVRSIEDYGIFIELTPNLAGLAEYKSHMQEGQQASVHIKNIIKNKMKIKLVIIEAFNEIKDPEPTKYFFDGDHIEKFTYSPENCTKIIETNFVNIETCVR